MTCWIARPLSDLDDRHQIGWVVDNSGDIMLLVFMVEDFHQPKTKEAARSWANVTLRVHRVLGGLPCAERSAKRMVNYLRGGE
jgi:hypothetical protein